METRRRNHEAATGDIGLMHYEVEQTGIGREHRFDMLAYAGRLSGTLWIIEVTGNSERLPPAGATTL